VGLVLLACAVGLWLMYRGNMEVRWITGILGLFGAFSIFQAMMGWCAVRAMGFKTKI